jgi:acyl-lipid (7-3)-desaturase (Delta-4 desaturase)
MPPDADKLRLRKQQPLGAGEELINSSNSDRVVTKLEQLLNHEVCIDGVIYDLRGFDHPGGESIMIFAGNDVTVQYRMIHPYHTGKHLEKMKKVGKVADYMSE